MSRISPSLRMVLLTAIFVFALHGSDWKIRVVNGSGGNSSSMRLDLYGNAHVASCYSGTLLYNFWDHKLDKWFTQSIAKCSGFVSLTLDSKQRPYISSAEGNGVITYAHWDGLAWQTQGVNVHAATVNYFTSIALDAQDHPSICFYEESGLDGKFARLRVVSWNGQFWELRTADGDLGSGKFNSMVFDSTGRLQVAYGNVMYQNTGLRYAVWDGKSWHIEVLDGVGGTGTSMWSVAMVLDQKDIPHIAYTDVKNRTIKYATKLDNKWQLETVDTIDGVGYPDRNGIALDCHGNPYISYYDSRRGLLKVAYQQGLKWFAEVVDDGFTGLTSSIQVNHDSVFVTYSDEMGQQLRFARKSLSEMNPPATGNNSESDQCREPEGSR